MSIAEITSPRLAALLYALRTLQEGGITAPLAAANTAIANEMQTTLTTLYGERLARHWDITTETAAAGTVARVRVASDDPRVIGYEYGTRAHPIVAHQPPRALAFQWQGQQAFFTRVNHPGTKPHDRRDLLRQALATTARQAWYDALRAALATAR